MNASSPVARSEDLLGARLVFLLFIQVVWGSNWLFGKIALHEVPPLALMTIRFALLFLAVVPFMRWHPGQMRGLVLIGLMGGALHFGIGFVALSLADDIAPLAIASNLGVPFATLLSAMFLGDRIGVWRGGALALAFGGVAVMGFDPRIFSYIEGMLLNVVSAFFGAVASILMRQTRGVGAFELQGWIGLCAFVPLGLASLAAEPGGFGAAAGASYGAWISLLYMAFVTSLVGHVGYTWLLQRHPIPQMAPFLLLSPIFAALFGVAFLGNIITWRMVFGGALTLGGVLIIILREARKRAP
jgi:O-acetylserine/cysteine efflux transporter